MRMLHTIGTIIFSFESSIAFNNSPFISKSLLSTGKFEPKEIMPKKTAMLFAREFSSWLKALVCFKK